MKFKTQWNAKDFPTKGEVNTQPSLTIPDQTLSIKQIMDRFSKGLPLDGHREAIYNGEDDDMPDLAHMDLADREQAIKEAQYEAETLADKIKEDKKQKALKQAKKAPLKQLEIQIADEGGEADEEAQGEGKN